MKKSAKIISFALAMALVFGMTLNVSQSPVAKAAETVSGGDVSGGDVTTPEGPSEAEEMYNVLAEIGADTIDGARLSITALPLSDEVYAAGKNAAMNAPVTDLKYESVVCAASVTVSDVTEQQLSQGVFVTFFLPSAKESESYAMFYQNSNGGWEQLAATVPAEGYVSAVFTYLPADLPVLVVKMTSATTQEAEVSQMYNAVESITAVAADGTPLTVTSSELSIEKYTEAKNTVSNAFANEQSRTILAAMDVEVAGVTSEQLAQGIRVTLQIPSVKAGNRYVVLHLPDGKEPTVPENWEHLTATVTQDGYMTVTFTSFSPIVVVELSDTDSGETGSGSSDTGNSGAEAAAVSTVTTAVSPKTGEMLPIAGIMAVIFLAGALFCARKLKR